LFRSFAELRSSEWSISRKLPTRVIVCDQPPAADRQYAESLYQEEKLKGSDDNIHSVEEKLTSVKTLVQKGLTITSRQMDLER
ncbi:exopolysaccharide biosynthesis protein, partial [Rhizobium leguminosarum]